MSARAIAAAASLALLAPTTAPPARRCDGTHVDYHGVGDEPQKLDLEKMLKVSRLIFATA